ncbi:MAG: hypothetical protein JJE47_06390 [Acidimicrobiia bacterium]|nr:hypothetical protein [Acidimicrobiia bacterium]
MKVPEIKVQYLPDHEAAYEGPFIDEDTAVLAFDTIDGPGWRLMYQFPAGHDSDYKMGGDIADVDWAVTEARKHLKSYATDAKVRENRIRRMANRQGFRIEKSRRRDPRAWDYGTYQLVGIDTNGVVFSDGGGTLDDIEDYLLGRGEWARTRQV